MTKTRSELLARISADWFHRGLISSDLAQQLAARYGRHDAFLSIVGRWLGIFAILMMASGVLALIGMSSGSPALIGVLLLLGAGAIWVAGVKLTTSKTKPMPVTGATLVTFSFVVFFAGCSAFLIEARDAKDAFFIVLLFVCAALAAATAYGFSLRWPLFLAALFLFHGVGSWGAYVGHGAYVFDIQHPPSMALAATLVMLLGIIHRRSEDGDLARYSGFGHIMIVFGLLYLNCSLWFMSLDWWDGHSVADVRVIWTLVFAAAALGQIVIGAFLKDSLFTGFGVVFLAINLYTQFFERFWDKMSIAMFFAVAGVVGIAIGFCFELLYRRQSAAERIAEKIEP